MQITQPNAQKEPAAAAGSCLFGISEDRIGRFPGPKASDPKSPPPNYTASSENWLL